MGNAFTAERSRDQKGKTVNCITFYPEVRAKKALGTPAVRGHKTCKRTQKALHKSHGVVKSQLKRGVGLYNTKGRGASEG